MKKFSNLAAALALSLIGTLTLSNCAVLLIGAAVGTAVYLEGELESHLPADITACVDATNLAAQQLGLRPISRTGDTSEALMIAMDQEERKVRIKLTPDDLNTKVTQIEIRVGAGGNEAASRRILSSIESNLKR